MYSTLHHVCWRRHFETDIYVYFDDVKYSFISESFLRAVDTVFKIFHVFNLHYPMESLIFWNFIESNFFEIESNNSFSKEFIY